MRTPKVLHIHGQEAEHDEAYIVGSPDALLKLSALLATAAGEQKLRAETFMVGDGEGFTVVAVPKELSLEQWGREIAVPYSRDTGRERDAGRLLPWDESGVRDVVTDALDRDAAAL